RDRRVTGVQTCALPIYIARASSWGHTSWEWTTEFTAPQLRSYIGARGIDVGDPQRIELTQLTGTGRVLSAKIVGSSGSRDIGKRSEERRVGRAGGYARV